MKSDTLPKNSSKAASAMDVPEWTISVEFTEIDFMDDDSVFVAGSTSDCSLVSPAPNQRIKNVRGRTKG